MNIDYLASFAATLLAISLASERLVTYLKTLFPRLGVERRNLLGEVDAKADRPRRLTVHVIAFLSGWVTAGFMVGENFNAFGSILFEFGKSNVGLPVWIVGILAGSGSAFWNNVLGYTKAVKDVRARDAVEVEGAGGGKVAERNVYPAFLRQAAETGHPDFLELEKRV